MCMCVGPEAYIRIDYGRCGNEYNASETCTGTHFDEDGALVGGVDGPHDERKGDGIGRRVHGCRRRGLREIVIVDGDGRRCGGDDAMSMRHVGPGLVAGGCGCKGSFFADGDERVLSAVCACEKPNGHGEGTEEAEKHKRAHEGRSPVEVAGADAPGRDGRRRVEEGRRVEAAWREVGHAGGGQERADMSVWRHNGRQMRR